MTLRCVLIDDETWTVVPRKATREMFVSGRSALRDNAHRSGRADVAWEAMVRVAPEPPEQKLAWQSELARAHAALRLFLEDDRFQVAVGGNPIAIEKMLAQARAALGEK